MRSPTLGEVIDAFRVRYRSAWADPGDPIGLVVGDPSATVERVLFAVDPVHAVIDEAIVLGAQLIVAHHPLLFRPVDSIAATTPKGAAVHDLVRNGIALYTAHTNADVAPGGVSDALAAVLGLVDVTPLVPANADELDKLVTFVPTAGVDALIDALAAAGAGSIGGYDRCAFVSPGTGTFRPGPAAHPAIGTRGEVAVVEEQRIEMVLPRSRRAEVVDALRRAHPYEEPAFDLLELASWPTARGIGRVGALPRSSSLREFADLVADRLPPTSAGVRVSGDLEREISRVAVVGGAGDAFLTDARASVVDVYLTSDLRHHPASEFREHVGAPALVDVAHWAAEWCWLPCAEADLLRAMADRELQLTTHVSRLCTDPWNHHVSTPRGGTP